MRKGFISSGQLGYLQGFHHANKIAGATLGLESSNLTWAFFVTAFQAGLDEFILPVEEVRSEIFALNIQDRIRPLSRRVTPDAALIDKTFREALPEGWTKKRDFDYARFCHWFLQDLFAGMHLHAIPIFMQGVPDPKEVKSRLPSSLALPLANLCSAIKPIELPGLIPKHEVMADDVTRLRELMSGHLFANYSARQNELDDVASPLDHTVLSIERSAEKIFSNNSHLVSMRKAAAGLLELSPKIVDAIAGKLPGALAEILAKWGLDFIDARRRIILYDFSNPLEAAFKSDLDRMLLLHEKGASEIK